MWRRCPPRRSTLFAFGNQCRFVEDHDPAAVLLYEDARSKIRTAAALTFLRSTACVLDAVDPSNGAVYVDRRVGHRNRKLLQSVPEPLIGLAYRIPTDVSR